MNAPYEKLIIGAGHLDPNDLQPGQDVTCLDSMYSRNFSTRIPHSNFDCHFVSEDMFEFLQTNPKKYDEVIADRIFEHVGYVGDKSIGFLLETLHKATKENAKLKIIVPNAILLCQKMQNLEDQLRQTRIYPRISKILNDILILNTEFTNVGEDPHQSIWTPELATIYIEQEGTWNITRIEEQMTFESRDIYMRIHCIRSQ